MLRVRGTTPIPADLDDAALEKRLFDLPESARPGRVMPDWVTVHDELKRRGVTLEMLWSEYRAACPDGIGYTQFCWHFGEWRKRLSPVMRQTYVAGDKLFVDWAGDTVPVIDVAGGGVVRRAHIFVAVLGASSFTFACATWTETLPDWIGCHVAALDVIGGVPKSTVPDNLKTGITTCFACGARRRRATSRASTERTRSLPITTASSCCPRARTSRVTRRKWKPPFASSSAIFLAV
jgi:transposase